MQSHDYVPGVSGWKIDPTTGAFELCSNQLTVSGFDPRATYCKKYAPGLGFRVGHLVVDAARFGVTSEGLTDMERAIKSGNACEILDLIASKISETKLGTDLKSLIDDQAREMLRAELNPGGMLHIAIHNR